MSFILDSGLKRLIGDLQNAKNNGKDIRILISNYMSVTEPSALYRLIELGYTKIFQDKIKPPFHPKAYIFVYSDGSGEAFIGSSNVSYTALTNGVEWNYNLKENQNSDDFFVICNQFNELYNNSSFDLSLDWIRSYEKSYKKSSYRPIHSEEGQTSQIEPIKFQIGALYELSRTREEGYSKALVVVATGLGKTYLAAFDSLGFKRILFIAHREEILSQAMTTFTRVHGNKKTYGLFKGYEKNTDSDIVFASIATLGKQNYLNDQYFNRFEFDYIVIDEFHHAAAASYQRVLDYFQPSFMLGMTATPDRADNGDIYELCDYNIAYECSMKTGINCGWLVPFEYFGIYDETDYTNIPWRNGSYDLNALENALIIDVRNSQIFEKYIAFKREKTLAFCASVRHCMSMKDYFSMKQVKCDVITGSTLPDSRARLLSEFTSGKLSVLFVVDVFNEGVDIPQIDMVMFLRPTSSYTIFIQQLGRGLRTSESKEKLRVLDFVGNYKYSVESQTLV